MSSSSDKSNAWEANAVFWDDYMGDESNYFHCDIVRPYTEQLLDIRAGDYVLDIACGNGNYSSRLASQGAEVVAFDYSFKMIELAKKRRADVLDRVQFSVCDATDYAQLLSLSSPRKFDKAVANMAIMDISDIEPLFMAVSEMLKAEGVFVFSTHHPCFTYPDAEYFKSSAYQGVAIEGQPELQDYYHRSIGEILGLAFKCGYVVDGFHEVALEGENEPIIMIVRLCKIH